MAPPIPAAAPARATLAAANAKALGSTHDADAGDGVTGPAESAGDGGGVGVANVRAVGSSRRWSADEGVNAGAAGFSFVLAGSGAGAGDVPSAAALVSEGPCRRFAEKILRRVILPQVHAGGPHCHNRVSHNARGV